MTDVHGDITDGRHARAQRSRQAVAEAMLDLIRRDGRRPQIHDVAVQAGVSERSVYRHYADFDALLLSAIDLQVSRVAHRFAPMGPMSPGEFIDRRVELYEEVAPIRRVAGLYAEHEPVTEALTFARIALRHQIETLFPDLDGTWLEAVDVATSWHTWNTLRVDQGLDVEAARATMLATVEAVLTAAAAAAVATSSAS